MRTKSMQYEYLEDKVVFVACAVIGLLKYAYDRFVMLNIHLQPDFWSTLTQGVLIAACSGAAGWAGKQVAVAAWKHISMYISGIRKRRRK